MQVKFLSLLLLRGKIRFVVVVIARRMLLKMKFLRCGGTFLVRRLVGFVELKDVAGVAEVDGRVEAEGGERRQRVHILLLLLLLILLLLLVLLVEALLLRSG